MRLRGALDTLLLAVLATAVVALGVEAAGRLDVARLEWGRARLIRIDDNTRARLVSLVDDVFVTYYVSPRERMPSHMRRLERDVTDLLRALAKGSGGRLDFQIVDPTDDPELARYASRRKVAPVRERHVSRDSYSEQEVWSTLTIAYGPRTPAMIHGVTPDHLPRLQALVVQHLDQLETPRRPVYAVAAPPGFEHFERSLTERGDVLPVDLDGGASIPPETDVLFWIEPRDASPARLVELQRFLATGRSLVVAGTPYDTRIDLTPRVEALLLRPNGFDAAAFWDAFGLRPVEGLVLDTRSATLTLGDQDVPAPFRVASIANNHDFHSMAFEPNGTLLFVAPFPLAQDGERLAELGYHAEVLATSSDETWMMPLGDGRLPFSAMVRGEAPPVAKQPLATWLRPRDPWHGTVVALAAASPFRDELFRAEGVAHSRLAQVLEATLAADDRLVTARAKVERPGPLPELPAGQRARWRLLHILLVPALMGAFALVRGGRSVLPRASGVRFALGLLLPLLLAGAAVSVLASSVGGRADWTADGTNSIHPTTRALAAAAVGEHAVTAELVFSPDEHMPPNMRAWSSRIAALLGALRAEGADLTVQWRFIDAPDDEQTATLGAEGLAPHRVTSTAEEVTTVRSVYSSLVLRTKRGREVLAFRDPRMLETLEFRVAFALWRLQTGRHPTVGFASDVPRLSAAEAHQFFQTQGLIPPQGKDVYSQARALVEGIDLTLVHVNPRMPEVPRDLDALIWLQPRRSITPMLTVLVDHLYKGGSAMIASQHFNMQSRQYPGTGFEFVYWPQPQAPDVELHWFPELGFEMVRQVLFDEMSTRVSLESQVTRGMRRDFDVMQSARTFNIRASAAGFHPTSPFTEGLGDQAFPWAAAFRWDDARLASVGLSATPLIRTSARSWLFDWKGGWIPNDVLAGPPVDEEGHAQWSPSLPLAVLLEGTFPWPKRSFVRAPTLFGADGAPAAVEEPAGYPIFEPVGEQRAGRLLFVGCSESFKDDRLTDPLLAEFRGDHMLLNAVTALALPADLAAVMARRPVARGFGVVDDSTRERLRWITVFSGPAALLAFALLRRLCVRRRPVFGMAA